MIQAKNSIKGTINTPQKVEGKINASIIRINPELEDLEITPSVLEQTFKSEKDGFNNVVVKAIDIKLQEKSVTPTSEEQTIIADDGYNGLNKVNVGAIQTEELNIIPSNVEQNFKSEKDGYSSVIVKGDENLVPENIRAGVKIFNVNGALDPVGDPEEIEELNNRIEELETQTENLETEVVNLKREIEEVSPYIETEIGKQIHIEDSADLPLKLVLYGKKEQEVGTGKNLFNITSPQKTDSRSGVQTTITDDGLITLNGTCNYDVWSDLLWGIAYNTVVRTQCKYYFDKTYENLTFSIKIISGTVTGTFRVAMNLNDDGEVGASIRTTTPSAVFTGEFKGINRAYIHLSKGSVFDNFKFYLQLEEGDVATDYEPYYETPSITHPSEIKTVGQNGSVEITIDNTLEETDINYQSQTKALPLQEELLDGDYLDNDKEYHNWAKIGSYNGESVSTQYISTTGQLTTGATVYYKLSTPKTLELTDGQKEVLNSLTTYRNKTNISVDGIGKIKVLYKRERE